MSMAVKFPIFGVHLWLPKAHVEAPVEGSMFLAAIILKLAGYGVIRLSLFLRNSTALLTLQALGIFGGAVVRFICLRQNDIKVIIAYSSVAHIGFAVFGVCSKSPLGIQAAITIIAAHGISSSGMFFGANLFYNHFHTRNTRLIKGGLVVLPSVALM